MSKTIYYLGAGASYGRREKETKNIIEGIPVVAEIPTEMDAFRSFISDAEVPSKETVFQNRYKTSKGYIESDKQEMLDDIDSLIEGIKQHSTIDTYARKLYLTGNKRDFEKLKRVLCAFFIWEQLDKKTDNRYDTFLANILEEKTLYLPSEISIISWNYDSQIEIAYQAYQNNAGLPVFEKNLQGKWPSLPNCGRVFKVNGTASFEDLPNVRLIKEDNNASPAIQLILFYHNTVVDTSELGFQCKTHLSFAGEDSPNRDNMSYSINATTQDTEQVVVIGYSFPFFNRETDREIFSGMPNLKKVYIQDINTATVTQSILAVLPKDKKIEVIPIPSCAQFYLPEEL